MTVKSFEEKGPDLVFCCAGARTAWDANALVIVPEPYGDEDPLVFTVAIDFEGGSALRIRYCPFCATPVTPSEPRAQRP